jgi:Fic family protein
VTNRRRYQESHPWISISFELDLRRIPWSLWVLLGEAQSKCEHLAGVPLQPNVAEQLHKLYLAKGALASTAIEGNTLSESDVMKLLEGKLKLPQSKQYLEREVQNIVDACNAVVESCVRSNPRGIDKAAIEVFNRLVLKGLAIDEAFVPGEVRRHEVGVARYRGAPTEDCGYLLEKLCSWLGGLQNNQTPVVFAILKAVLAHLYLAWIHPFGDGNGRTARLVEFYLLVSAGVPSPAAHLLSNHYNETRALYYRQLDASSRSGGDVVPFIVYAVQGFVDGLRTQIALVRKQQLQVAWANLVHEMFRDGSSASAVRKRRLILDLSQMEEPVEKDEITRITPRIAEAYAGRTVRTLSRDLEDLKRMGLLERVGKKYRAKTELIQAFLPLRSGRISDDELPSTVREIPPSIAPHRHECVDCGRSYDCTCEDPKEQLTKKEAEARGWPIRCPECEIAQTSPQTVAS